MNRLRNAEAGVSAACGDSPRSHPHCVGPLLPGSRRYWHIVPGCANTSRVICLVWLTASTL
jgi:hypothetical protein